MTKRNQLIAFVLLIALGIFLLNRFLFPAGKTCKCLDFQAAEDDCYAACYPDECALFYAAQYPGGCFYDACVFKMVNYCENRDTGQIYTVIGYLYTWGCTDCIWAT